MTYDIALERMPHRGPMQLIEQVLEADETSIRCRAKAHQDQAYPLRVDGFLHSTALVELGAQAAAAHASLFGIGTAHAGLLLALSGVEVGEIDPNRVAGAFHVQAQRLDGDAGSARYRFQVETSATSETPLVLGNAVLSMVASA